MQQNGYTDFLTRLFQKVIDRGFSTKLDIFCTLFDNSLKFCKQMKILAFSSTHTQKLLYYGNKMD